jgi:hypothetical protein
MNDIKPIVQLAVSLDAEELMDNVFHNLWRSTSPWIVKYGYGSFDETPTVDVKHFNRDEEVTTTNVTPEMLATGLTYCITKQLHHCFTYAVSADMDDWDTCVSDMVLQAAVFGEVVFG